MVSPIEAWIAKEVFCTWTEVEFVKRTSGMLKLEVLGSSDGGGRIAPGGGHSESTVGTSKETAIVLELIIFGTSGV
jgi:hypothetical protein